MNKLFNLPGTAYVAIISFASMFLTDYFGAEPWVPVAVAALGGLLKFVQLMTEPTPPQPPPGVMADAAQKQPSKVARWLVG
jgi:hypothetical protein